MGNRIDLRMHEINQGYAAELRGRLATFAEDWESPEMEIYDNYDAAQAYKRGDVALIRRDRLNET